MGIKIKNLPIKDKITDQDYLIVDDNIVTSKILANHAIPTSQQIATWDGKQDKLVAGVNIKTVNNQSLLGPGNITIQGGSGGGGTSTFIIEYAATPGASIIAAFESQQDLILKYQDSNETVLLANSGYKQLADGYKYEFAATQNNYDYAASITCSTDYAVEAGYAISKTPSIKEVKINGGVKTANDGTLDLGNNYLQSDTIVLGDGCIELIPSTGGGYIDFHLNGSTSDFTSRIVEYDSGLHIQYAGQAAQYLIASSQLKEIKPISQSEYAAISSPDPTILYLLLEDS